MTSERMIELYDAMLGYIVELVAPSELEKTLKDIIGMTDKEIEEEGIYW